MPEYGDQSLYSQEVEEDQDTTTVLGAQVKRGRPWRPWPQGGLNHAGEQGEEPRSWVHTHWYQDPRMEKRSYRMGSASHLANLGKQWPGPSTSRAGHPPGGQAAARATQFVRSFLEKQKATGFHGNSIQDRKPMVPGWWRQSAGGDQDTWRPSKRLVTPARENRGRSDRLHPWGVVKRNAVPNLG